MHPLLRPAFRRLWLGLVISRLGDTFTVIALIWFVLQLTGAGAAIGLVVLFFQLPTLISGPVMGRLLDRYQPRTVMAVDNFGRACIIAAIPGLYWLGALQIWMVYVLALFAGILSPATEVGMRMVIPKLVADEELEKANSLSSISWDFAGLVGPATAGFLVAILNGPSVLLIDAVSFLIMGAMVLSMPDIQRGQTTSEHTGERRSFLGISTLLSMRVVCLITALTLAFLFLQGMTEVVLPVYSQKTLATGATGYGLLMSAFSVGSLLALILISRFWSKSNRPGIALSAIFILSGLLLAPLVFLKILPLAMLVLALAGFASAPYYVLEQSLMQRLVPDRLRGQIFGIRSALSTCGYPLGGALGGLLLEFLAAPLVIGLAALLYVLIGMAALLSPPLQNAFTGRDKSRHIEHR